MFKLSPGKQEIHDIYMPGSRKPVGSSMGNWIPGDGSVRMSLGHFAQWLKDISSGINGVPINEYLFTFTMQWTVPDEEHQEQGAGRTIPASVTAQFGGFFKVPEDIVTDRGQANQGIMVEIPIRQRSG